MGKLGRTPVPVAESTCHPEEKPFTPGEVPRGERPDQRVESPTHEQDRGETIEGDRGDRQEGEPKWALPEPFDPRRPLGEGAARGEVPSQVTGEWEEKPEQEYPTPEQQLIEADRRHRKRLAALTRDHIVKSGRSDSEWSMTG